MELRAITTDQLADILEKHNKWVLGQPEGERADLREANLRGADLRWANLRGADLRWANLRGANLRWADLQGADLQGADLPWADLRWADLRRANLRWANLRWANLQEVNLQETDLRGANLREANLLRTILDFSGFPLSCQGTQIKVDDRFVFQFIYHLTRQDHSACSDEVKDWLAAIPTEIADGFLKYREDLVPYKPEAR